MSTIEKAASRLAARQQSNAGQASQSRSQGRTRGGPGKAAAGSRVSAAPDTPRFCDIDLEEIGSRGFLLPDAGRTRLAQEMRRIKRPLLLNVQKWWARRQEASADGPDMGPPANLIMITSALPGEGKTFTAINLAMSIAAEVDRRVLLVDADVARGDVSRQLGIGPCRGLSDLLRESNYLFEDAVLTSNVERVSILPAGAPTDQVDELFASEMMGVVTRSLAEADDSRVVIFDASPLMATTEAAVLARHMGQTVVVVEAGRTPEDALAQAAAQLDGCANVSLLLNKISGNNGIGYGYGYGYGYGADGVGEREAELSDAAKVKGAAQLREATEANEAAKVDEDAK